MRLFLLLVLLCNLASVFAAADQPAQPWPPKLGDSYPDLTLRDLDGNAVQLASLAGKPLLIEPVGMNCPGCQAYVGGNDQGVGGFGGVRPQGGLESLETYLPQYTDGLQMNDDRFTYVVVIFYGMDMQAPSVAEARAWSEHFGLTDQDNCVVLVGDERHINRATWNLIPGVQLVDEDFVLRSDATGHHPQHNFWDHTFPKLAEAVGQ